MKCKCGCRVELLAYIGDWNEETDLYNYACKNCGNSGICGLEICSECKKGVLQFDYYNEYIEADIYSCDNCLKEFIKTDN